MPLGKGVRYRFRGKTRLAFRGNAVVETRKFKGRKGSMKIRGVPPSFGAAMLVGSVAAPLIIRADGDD